MLRDVTSVVLNYRTPDKTLTCLQSLVAEGIARIVLVENSEDGGAALDAMQPGLNALEKAGTHIHIVDEGRNLGFAAGVNRALAYTQANDAGPVLLLNSDARLEPGALSHLLDAIEAGADIAAPLIAAPGHTALPPRFYYHKYLALLTQRPLWGSFSYITGACMLLAPQIAKSGLFDEDFFFYGEDVMLGAAMAWQGKNCVVVQSSRVEHEGSGSARNGSLFYEYHINRGHWLLARKLSNERAVYASMIFGRILTLSLRSIIRTVRFRNMIALKGFLAATKSVIKNRQDISKPLY